MKLGHRQKALVALILASVALLAVLIVMSRTDLEPVANESNTVPAPTAGQRDDPSPAAPDYAPPATKAPELAALVDRNAKDRVTSDITTRIPRIRFDEDIPVVASVLKDTGDDDTARHEAANLLRRSGYRELTDDLTKVLENPDEGERFRAFCVQHLWLNSKKAGPGELAEITESLRDGERGPEC